MKQLVSKAGRERKTRWWRAWARLPAEDPQIAFVFMIEET
jgi:hypothetical protein